MKLLKNTHIYIAIVVAAFLWLGSAKPAPAQENNAQTSELYKLQAAYHRTASVHDPVNGDSPEKITERIREMLSLWTAGAVLQVTVGSAVVDGYYLGNGDPDDPSTCPAPASDPNNRGSLCTFFKYLSGAFRPGNKWVSLAPSYKTTFDVHGNSATVYFECHYFNVAIDPTTSQPFWTSVSHASFNGSAQNVNGRWQFSYVYAAIPPVPVP
jgi:hypothetical protein